MATHPSSSRSLPSRSLAQTGVPLGDVALARAGDLERRRCGDRSRRARGHRPPKPRGLTTAIRLVALAPSPSAISFPLLAAFFAPFYDLTAASLPLRYPFALAASAAASLYVQSLEFPLLDI